jgi:hypothetical protein
MLEASGCKPIASSIAQDWVELEPVCMNLNARMRPDVLEKLRSTPRSFAMLEGLCAVGFIWWNGSEWKWERWHWGRWPIQVATGLADIAYQAGAKQP